MGEKVQLLEKDVMAAGIHALLPYCRWLARINGGSRYVRGGGVLKTYRLYRPEVAGEDKSIRLPDVIGQLNDGRMIAVEFKAKGGIVTDEQALFLNLVRMAGGIAGVCYDADDVFDLIESANEDE